MGQAHAPVRRIAGRTHRCKLTSWKGHTGWRTKRSASEGIWRRRSLPRAMVSVWIKRAGSMRTSRSVNTGSPWRA
jgi:hypothetical protein